MKILEAALGYAGRGYSVIPIKPNIDEDNKKRPYISWQEFQTRKATEAEIRSWWNKWPGAMIGLVTGQISGLFVVDCDTQEGFDTVQGHLPDSLEIPTARTPRGGWHFYFQNPVNSGLTTKAGILAGVDIRGEGGYIIAAPSKNAEGKLYGWLEGLSLAEVAPPPPLPDALLSALLINNNLYKGGCGQDNSQRPQETTKTTSDHSFFTQGRRDDDLFHVANCLIKGGCEKPFADYVLNILANNSTPPFPENEIQAKIESAMKRIETRERNLAAEIREWVLTTSGHFLTTDCHKELQLTTRDHMKAANMALLRLCEGAKPLIEKFGDRRGCYRKIETDLDPVDFLNAPTADFPLTLPLGISDYCMLYPGNIVMVAGSKSAGKTAFLLNIVKENMQRQEIVYLNSEMGDTEFRKRLELFGAPLSDWKFKAYHRSSGFADIITPERKIFIIDFLEVTTDFWKVAQYIQEIHKKLKEGIAIIALQKSEGKDTGRGGDFSKEKARLYLSLDYLADKKVNQVKITDAKAWRTSTNPRGMYRHYKLANGSAYYPVSAWEG
jgi:hypothetical protein